MMKLPIPMDAARSRRRFTSWQIKVRIKAQRKVSIPPRLGILRKAVTHGRHEDRTDGRLSKSYVGRIYSCP